MLTVCDSLTAHFTILAGKTKAPRHKIDLRFGCKRNQTGTVLLRGNAARQVIRVNFDEGASRNNKLVATERVARANRIRL